MTFRVGVDVGGSFTDFAVLNEADSSIATLKVFSRPDAPGSEIVKGLETLRERDGLDPTAIASFTHGTTVGVNTVIQRNGLKLALFTTRNFEDVLQIGRLKIPEIHNLYSVRPEPLVTRDCVFGLDERTSAAGEILLPLDRASVEAAVRGAMAAGCEGIVISLLHAYRNAANETAAKALVQEIAPGLPVFSSAEIWPIIREYERTITATISGYVQPKVAHYLASFERVLRETGVSCPLHITKTNGGVMGIAQAKDECVQMILSGTASGVIGAGYIARACGFPKILSLDIGGTSADVAVIVEGEAERGVGEIIGDFQIFVPSVSVTSVGQGGGSVAWIDGHGVLKAGPDSAGSTPGPVCFGRGGTRPTITDAVAALNLIGHSELGYGAVRLDTDASRAAIRPLAEALGISTEEAAETILLISISGMYAEVSGLISRFGIDPREFHLFAFGGAGPMLACFLARELNMKGVVVPPTPGVVSALGGLIADLKNDFIETLYADLSPAMVASLPARLAALKTKALGWLREEQAFAGPASIACSADMRYQGQSYEIETVLDEAWLQGADAARIEAAFHAEHERLFGHADPGAGIQIISLRLVVSGATPKPAIRRIEPATGPAGIEAHVAAHLDGAARDVPLYRRASLRAGHRFASPAIVAQDDCTTIVPPGFDVVVDDFGNLVITPDTSVRAGE